MNALSTCQGEHNSSLGAVLGMDLVINTGIHLNHDEGMVDVAYIDTMIIGTKGSFEKHWGQVGNILDVLLVKRIVEQHNMRDFDQWKALLLVAIVCGHSSRMDIGKTLAIMVWYRPVNQQEVKQKVGLGIL